MKQQFYVTGYIGEGAKYMLLDLINMENIQLIDQGINNKYIRFLYYYCNRITDDFRKFHFLKKIFYPWFTILRLQYKENVENCILFFNSGFCRELDFTVVERLKKKNPNVKLVLYIVDPMTGFGSSEHLKIIESMDFVYSINKADCERYGFSYYPLIYSKVIKDEKETDELLKTEKENIDLYYLGSGDDRTKILMEIQQRCKTESVKADFHVLSKASEGEGEELTFHKKTVSYTENVEFLKQANCILEIMHKDFDNPTQRYAEAVVYNKKLLTNNPKAVSFDFYNPKYIQIFQSIKEIDMDFVKNRESIDYDYREEFSPRFFIQEIASRVMKGI